MSEAEAREHFEQAEAGVRLGMIVMDMLQDRASSLPLSMATDAELKSAQRVVRRALGMRRKGHMSHAIDAEVRRRVRAEAERVDSAVMQKAG